MQVSQVASASNIDSSFPPGFSFFEPYIHCSVKEVLEIGGEAYVSKDDDGAVSGIFIFDSAEKVGTIYTRQREVFDYFSGLKQFNYVFSELQTELENEVYDIYSMNLADCSVIHRFSYEISMAQKEQTAELERFMALTHPGINRKWVGVALANGERCFTVRLNGEIAGVGWVSLVNGVGRLHSLFVKPPFRRMGLGEDILNARLLWLKSRGAKSVFCEVSRLNVASAGNITKAGLRATAQVYQYRKKPPAKAVT